MAMQAETEKEKLLTHYSIWDGVVVRALASRTVVTVRESDLRPRHL